MTTMSANCAGLSIRPWISTVYWKFWLDGAGGTPIWPAATCWFCCLMTLTTSSGTRPKLYSFCGSIHTRMAYSPTPNTLTLPTPGTRASSLTRLMDA